MEVTNTDTEDGLTIWGAGERARDRASEGLGCCRSSPSLVLAPHPLLAAADRRLVYTPFQPGESIADYLARAGIELGDRPWILHLNDQPIPRSEWALTVPRAGDLITLRALVQGGGGGGSDPLRTVLMIALMVAAPMFAPALLPYGAGATAFAFTQGLVIVGGMMLIDRIAPLQLPGGGLPDGRNDNSSPTYGLSGVSNRARLYEPLPLVCGTHIIYPDLGAKFYTEFDGEDQYLYAVLNFGLADIALSSFRIGATPLADFDGVETQESDGTGALTLFPANVDTLAGGALTQAAGWMAKTSSLSATALAIDITGLLFYAGDGGLQARAVDLEIEYRAVGAGSWSPFLDSPVFGSPAWSANAYFSVGNVVVPTAYNGHCYRRSMVPPFPSNYPLPYAGNLSGGSAPAWPTASGAFVADGAPFTGYDYEGNPIGTFQPGWVEAGAVSASNVYLVNSARTPLRKTYRRNVASGQYEVRARRMTADETDDRATSDIAWSQLRTYQPDTADYTGQKRLALRIKASGQLQGGIEQFNAIAAASVPAWNGSSWVTQATSNPAWIYLWFARGKSIAGRRVFGGLLPDSRLDIETIKTWGAWCTSKGLTFDFVFDQAQNCKEMLAIIARAGRAAPTWASGKLGVVWDEANKPAVAVFGMGNIRRGTFSVEYLTGPVADEIVCEFINPDLDWQPDTVRVTVPGVTSPVRPARVQLLGCKSKTLAGKEANLLAAQQVSRRRSIIWESDFEGMVVQRGDVVTLSHDLTQWGYSGRCFAGNGATLTLERKVPFTPSQSHYVGVVFPNGYYQIFAVQYQAGESDVLALTGAWPTLDDLGNTLYTPSSDPNHPPYDYKFVFDPKATPGKKVKITEIKPLSERHVRLVATDEDPAYYAAESGSYTYVPPATYGAQAPTISSLAVADTLIRNGSVYATTIAVTWNVSGPYGEAIISAAPNGSPRGVIGRTRERRFEFTGPASGALDIEVKLLGPTGEHIAAGTATKTHQILGKTVKPANVTGFSASQNGRFVVFKWNEIADVDRDGYEIRRAPQGVIDWNSAMLVVEAEQGTQMTAGSVPPGAWTFLIKAKDTSGLFSVAATRYDLDVVNALDVIYQKEQAPDWLGVKTNCLVHWAGKLVPMSTKTVDQLTIQELFEQFAPYPVASYSYEPPEIDLGFDSDVRVYAETAAALGRGRDGVADPRLAIDYRIEAGVYDGFDDWSAGDVRARYIKQKLTLDTSKGVAYVSGMKPVADTEEWAQAGEIISALGGVTVTFPGRYHIIADFQVTPRASTAHYATYENLTGVDALVHVWNSSGTEVAGVPAGWSSLGA